MSNYQRVEEQDFVAEAIVLDPSAKRRPLFPIFFKTLIFSLLVVFPFFMGGKEPSIRLLAQGVIFAAIGCFAVLVSLGRQPIWLTPVSATLLKFIGAFSLLIIFQLIPWPLSILAVFSPAGEKLYQTTGVASAPISLNYFASVEALLWSLSVLGLTALTLLLPQEQLQIRLSREMKSRGAGANPLLNLARTTEAIADGLQTSVIYTGLLFSVIALLHLTTTTPALFGFFLPGGVSLGSPRAHWPFVNPNHLAVFLEVSIILLGARFFVYWSCKTTKTLCVGSRVWDCGLFVIRRSTTGKLLCCCSC